MNAKFLFAATLAVSALSLAGTVAMAAEATGPLTRAEVKAETAGNRGSAARGELYGQPALPSTFAPSTVHRSEVIAELRAERTAHPYDNVGQRDVQSTVDSAYASSTLARAEVKAEVRHAMADGTLLRNGEVDSDSSGTNSTLRRAAHQHLALASR